MNQEQIIIEKLGAIEKNQAEIKELIGKAVEQLTKPINVSRERILDKLNHPYTHKIYYDDVED